MSGARSARLSHRILRVASLALVLTGSARVAHAEDPPPGPLEWRGEAVTRVTAYAQGQYESHQDSQDQLTQGGQLLNQNRFSVRRARVRLDRDTEWTSLTLELDANTTNGPQVDLRKAEASIVLRGDRSLTELPWLKATIGMFDTPFGFELTESPKSRFFMERSIASRAFFPAEPDLGFRLSGGIGFVRYAFALVNGEPLDEKNGFTLRDPNSSKDAVLRIGVDTEVTEGLNARGGVSVLRGTGFHAGTAATKDSVTWHDINEDGTVQPDEIVGSPGSAATPSQNFSRWAVGADAGVTWTNWFGTTELRAEVVVAQNLDRGLYVADPVQSSQDVRELGFHLGMTQWLAPYGMIGVRYELYDPNSDFLDQRVGKLLPSSERLRTLSPIVGLVLNHRARLLFQEDFNDNYLARDVRGVPTRLRNDASTIRLQVEM